MVHLPRSEKLSGILRNNLGSGCATVGIGMDPSPLTSLKAIHSP